MIKRSFKIDFGKSSNHSLDYLLGILDDARVTTLRRVENLSIQELDWQYKEGWNSIGALLSHINAIEHFFRIEFVEGRKLTEEENYKWQPGLEMGTFIPQLIKSQPIEKYIAELADSRRLLIQSLKPITFDHFVKRIEGYDPETGCNLAWVLYHLAEDEVHHRGQISILRKLYKETASNAMVKD
jgi:hypothetical protein